MNENKALMEEWARCWTEQDRVGFLRLFTPDAIYEDMALEHAFTGPAEIGGFFDSTIRAFPDLGFTLQALVADGGLVTSEWLMTGTHLGPTPNHAPTGKSFSFNGMSIMEVRGRAVDRHRDYWNLRSMQSQLGL